MKNITIAGNCTKDGELRTTQSGQKVASVSIAVNGYSNGEKTTDYFDVSMWGKRGEAMMKFANKGAKLCVSGELGTREYNGKTYLTVNAHDFTPMGGGNSGGQSGGGYDQGQQGGYGGGFDDSEIPF
jgi:single-strand DNA-binding protein